jgi:hypothetical protein
MVEAAVLEHQVERVVAGDIPQHVVARLLPQTVLERHVHDLVRQHEQDLVVGQASP